MEVQVRRLTDELQEVRADRDLAEAEDRSLRARNAELRAELLRLQAQAARAADYRGREAEARRAEVIDARAGLEEERERHRQTTSLIAGLQADLDSLRSRLVGAEAEIETLSRERETILSSTTWKLVSRLTKTFGGLRRT